jgi:hypothetical protein
VKFASLGAAFLGVAVLAGVHPASASTFQYGSYTVKNEQNINIFSPNNISGKVGQIALAGSGPNATQTILAWCLDIYDFLANSGTYNIGVLTTAGSGGSHPTALTNTQIGEIGALIAHGDSLVNSSHDVSAAIQLAIWEVEYSGFSSDGVTPSVSALAAQYVNDVTGTSPTWAPDNNVGLLTQSGNQSLGFLTPLPSTWTMMISVLAVLGVFALRRQKLNSDEFPEAESRKNVVLT